MKDICFNEDVMMVKSKSVNVRRCYMSVYMFILASSLHVSLQGKYPTSFYSTLTVSFDKAGN